MAPAQTWEPRVVTIRSDPFSPRFHRQRRAVGSAYQIPFGSHRLAQSSEDFPMALAWRNQNASGLLAQMIHVPKGNFQRCCIRKYPWMGHDSERIAPGRRNNLALAGFSAIQSRRHLQERPHHVPELLAIRAQGNGMRGAGQNDELPVLIRELLIEIQKLPYQDRQFVV